MAISILMVSMSRHVHTSHFGQVMQELFLKSTLSSAEAFRVRFGAFRGFIFVLHDVLQEKEHAQGERSCEHNMAETSSLVSDIEELETSMHNLSVLTVK